MFGCSDVWMFISASLTDTKREAVEDVGISFSVTAKSEPGVVC